MFKNLNVKKIKNNNDYLINKFNTYNEFSNNIEDDFSKIRISKKTIDFDEALKLHGFTLRNRHIGRSL